MELASGAGISGRQEGCSELHDAVDAAAPYRANAEVERLLQSLGLDDGAHRADDPSARSVGEPTPVPPATPPDEPGAMGQQALEPWSLADLVGVPRLGRLLSAVQRTAG